ncbi:TadE family protein [Neobacillus drentensis]|uniref:TadE family protein n=1 Tax=Neobacillus drentensis TaxID=220684 RepID=UPI002FFF0E3A
MKSEKGQALVEFALSVTALVFLLLGIIDFGRVFFVYLTMDNAGRETARAVSIGKVKTDIDIQNYAVNSFNKNTGPLNISPLTVGDVIPGGTRTSGQEFELQISYNVTFLTPLIGQIWGENRPIKNTTTMRVE